MIPGIESLIKKISEGKANPLILIGGDDRGLKKEAFKIICDALLKDGSPDTNLESYGENHPAVPDIISNIMTRPFFPGNKILALIDWDMKNIEERHLKMFSSSIETGIPEGNFLIVIPEDVPDKRTTFYKQIKKSWELLEFAKETKISDSELPQILNGYFSEKGFSINSDALRQLIIKSDFDYYKTRIEADKLMLTLSSGKGVRVTLADVERIVTSNKSTVVFELLDSIGRKEAGRSVELFRALVRSGEEEMQIVYMISRRFHSFLQFYDFMEKMEFRKPKGNINYDMFMKSIHPLIRSFNESYLSGKANLISGHPFYVFNLMLAALNFSPQSAAKAIRVLRECDVELKSFGMSKGIIVEKLILSLVSL
ncbi:MAG: DNA polymerase III subunit delta [Candidatus Schekmanbacteria bacterium]|nr:DNA polymerase III subunit delta [Candidatus Schekmanbacteria bacterium]